MGIDADAGLSLRTFERPPVREVLWSPLGIAKDGGCYLSVLDSTLHMHLYAASPNGWTGSWKESPRPSLPMMEIASKREALIDLHIMSHCWTERLPDARKPTSLLLASTRTGRLLSTCRGNTSLASRSLQTPSCCRCLHTSEGTSPISSHADLGAQHLQTPDRRVPSACSRAQLHYGLPLSPRWHSSISFIRARQEPSAVASTPLAQLCRAVTESRSPDSYTRRNLLWRCRDKSKSSISFPLLKIIPGLTLSNGVQPTREASTRI